MWHFKPGEWFLILSCRPFFSDRGIYIPFTYIILLFSWWFQAFKSVFSYIFWILTENIFPVNKYNVVQFYFQMFILLWVCKLKGFPSLRKQLVKRSISSKDNHIILKETLVGFYLFNMNITLCRQFDFLLKKTWFHCVSLLGKEL